MASIAPTGSDAALARPHANANHMGLVAVSESGRAAVDAFTSPETCAPWFPASIWLAISIPRTVSRPECTSAGLVCLFETAVAWHRPQGQEVRPRLLVPVNIIIVVPATPQLDRIDKSSTHLLLRKRCALTSWDFYFKSPPPHPTSTSRMSTTAFMLPRFFAARVPFSVSLSSLSPCQYSQS